MNKPWPLSHAEYTYGLHIPLAPPSKYVKVAVLLVSMQLAAATSIVCLALYGRVSVVSLICEVVVIMLVPLMV